MKSVSENLLKINYRNVNQFDDCHCSKYKKQVAKATEALKRISSITPTCDETYRDKDSCRDSCEIANRIASKALKELGND